MNEIRRAKLHVLMEQQEGVRESLDKIVGEEFIAHRNMPDSIEYSDWGTAEREAMDKLIAAQVFMDNAVALIKEAVECSP
jgi:hypothetical protein